MIFEEEFLKMPKQLTVLASDGLQAIKPDKSKLQ